MSPQTHDWERIRKYITEAVNKERKEFLEDLNGFELKRFSDMMRTLERLREKYKKRLNNGL